MRFKFVQNKDNYIWLILCLALLLRLGAFFSFQPWEDEVVSTKILKTDGASYHNFALNILEGTDSGETFWAPGLPVFLAAIYTVFGVKLWVVLLFNCFISTASVLILYKIAKSFFAVNVAIISSFLLAIDPHQVIYSQTLLTENVFIPLILLFFLFYIRYMSNRKFLLLVVTAVFLGLSMYFRPVANYLFIFVAGAIILQTQHSWFKKVSRVLWFVFFLVLTLSPWLIRNYKIHNHFGLTTNGGYNLLYIFAGSIYNNQFQMHPDSTEKMLKRKMYESGGEQIKNPFVLDQNEKSVAFELIKEEPVKFFQNYFSGCLNIYTSLSSYQISSILGLEGSYVLSRNFYGVSQLSQVDYFLEERKTEVIIISTTVLIFLAFSYLLMILGMFKLIKDARYKEFILMFGMIIYFTMIVGTLGSGARFKLPISPFLFMFSAVGIVYVYDKWKGEKQKKLVDNTKG